MFNQNIITIWISGFVYLCPEFTGFACLCPWFSDIPSAFTKFASIYAIINLKLTSIFNDIEANLNFMGFPNLWL